MSEGVLVEQIELLKKERDEVRSTIMAVHQQQPARLPPAERADDQEAGLAVEEAAGRIGQQQAPPNGTGQVSDLLQPLEGEHERSYKSADPYQLAAEPVDGKPKTLPNPRGFPSEQVPVPFGGLPFDLTTAN